MLELPVSEIVGRPIDKPRHAPNQGVPASIVISGVTYYLLRDDDTNEILRDDDTNQPLYDEAA